MPAVAVILGVTLVPAAAQGRSGSPPDRPTRPIPPTATSSPATSEGQQVYSGSWFDDATLLPAGTAFVSMSALYYSAAGARQVDAPVSTVSLGASSRVNLGFSVPFYYVRDSTGDVAHGVGQMYFYGKIALREVSILGDGLAVAVSPVIELQRDTTSAGNPEQVSVAAPVSIEYRHGGARVYGSAGYFSRGALFTSLAASATAHAFTLTGQLGYTYSTASTTATATTSRRETDVGIGLSAAATSRVSIFGAAGRSFTGVSTPGTWFTGGLAVLVGPR